MLTTCSENGNHSLLCVRHTYTRGAWHATRSPSACRRGLDALPAAARDVTILLVVDRHLRDARARLDLHVGGGDAEVAAAVATDLGVCGAGAGWKRVGSGTLADSVRVR